MSRALFSNHPIKAVIGVLIALLVAALPILPFGVAAQSESESIETTLTKSEIRVTGPAFALDDVALEEYPHGEGERIYISGVDHRSFAEIAFFDDTDTPEDTIEVMMRSFESESQEFSIIESGDEDGIYHALAKFRLSNENLGYFYIEVAEDIDGNVDFVQSLYTINEDFGEQLSVASNEISIAGNAFLGVTAVDVSEVIAADRVASATPIATPGPEHYEYKWADSVVEVRPPIALDFNNQTAEMESVFASSETGYAYVGFLKSPSDSPEAALDMIFEGAPRGSSGPVQLHSEATTEQIRAVYRIPVDGATTIMVIEISAAGDGLWQVEALAAPEGDILTELDVFQRSISIDGTGFLQNTSIEEVETILAGDQP